ncbi:MAG: hypothetical protein RDV48_14295 [Candidatus Eremiobacteraeota bacterium]|nr:hypothetical protein [Candidatus Eremiobacteraeota bacterium]
MTWNDPIVEEVRTVRREIEAELGFDFDSFSKHLYEMQSRSPRKPLESSDLESRKTGKKAGD